MELKEFLIKAKIATYASKGEGDEKVLGDGLKELSYATGPWRYRDRYFGYSHFIGQEIVWYNQKAVWGMNYYGGLLSCEISPKEIYGFLRKAMQLVKEDRPFRGPSEYREEELLYKDTSIGDIKNFSGLEEIFYKGEKTYELQYRGGVIQNK